MRHQRRHKKFGRGIDQRRALVRSLAESLLERGQIRTTLVKAKALRPFVERVITLAKKNNLSSRRLLISRLGTVSRARLAVKAVSGKYVHRAGGYTRILKVGPRRGDASPMAIIELVEK